MPKPENIIIDNTTINDELTDLRAKFIELDNKYNEQLTENKNLGDKYSALLDKNHDLFLSQTSKQQPHNLVDTTQDEDAEYSQYIGKELYDSLSISQKELVKTVLRGED